VSLWTVLLLSPEVVPMLVTGSDKPANSIAVSVFSVWVIREHTKQDVAPWKMVISAVFLGIALSWRPNFLLLLPLIFGAIASRNRLKWGAIAIAVTVVAFLGVTLPVYMWEPDAFSPLHAYGELGRFDEILSNAGLIIPALAGAAASLPAVRENGSVQRYLVHSTLVLAIPVAFGIPLLCLEYGVIDLSFSSFGISFLFFGVLAGWPEAWKPPCAWMTVNQRQGQEYLPHEE
jgi:hypothetical protein